MKKTIYIIMVVLLFGAMGVGIYNKTTFTDYMAYEAHNINDFKAVLFSDEFGDDIFDRYKKVLSQYPIVLRVSSSGEHRYIYDMIKQKVEIVDVYKGDTSLIGEKIELVYNRLDVNCSEKLFNLGFINLMKENHEYLVFCEEEIESPLYDDKEKLFRIGDAVITPIFDCSKEIDNKIPMNFDKETSETAYAEVCDNEFFAESSNMLEKYLKCKDEIMKEYIK